MLHEEKIILKIVSDGTPEGTSIKDSAGRVLDNVIDFKYNLNATDLPTVTIELVGVEVSINSKPKFTNLQGLADSKYPQTHIQATTSGVTVISTDDKGAVTLLAENI